MFVTKMIDDISRLIYRSLVGTMTDDERQRLEAWMAESEGNRLAVSRLTDRQYLKREYLRKQAVDIRRPLEDMQRRIEAVKEPVRIIPVGWRRYAAAAAVFLLIASMGIYLYNKVGQSADSVAITSQQTDTEITHGTTQALLTLANGQTVSLGGILRMERGGLLSDVRDDNLRGCQRRPDLTSGEHKGVRCGRIERYGGKHPYDPSRR